MRWSLPLLALSLAASELADDETLTLDVGFDGRVHRDDIAPIDGSQSESPPLPAHLEIAITVGGQRKTLRFATRSDYWQEANDFARRLGLPPRAEDSIVERMSAALDAALAAALPWQPPAHDLALHCNRGVWRDESGQVEVGRGSYGWRYLSEDGGAAPLDLRARWSDARLIVGKFSMIADGVSVLLGANHHLSRVSMFPFLAPGGAAFSKGDVVVGSDVWIGAQAMLLSGVRVGDGAVIGARAVVAKDVPPYAVAVGNPARVVKYRFDNATIARLLEVRWWDWPRRRIEELATTELISEDVEGFLANAGLPHITTEEQQ